MEGVAQMHSLQESQVEGGSDAFTVKGFINWKKVNGGKECAFLTHVSKGSNLTCNFSV